MVEVFVDQKSERRVGVSEPFRQAVIDQYEKRWAWKEINNSLSLRNMLEEEFEELAMAVGRGDENEMQGEIGDLIYFGIVYEFEVGELPEDLLMLSEIVMDLSKEKGWDVEQCLLMKLVRNQLKYPKDKEDGIGAVEWMKLSQKNWSERGGDERFYPLYVGLFEGLGERKIEQSDNGWGVKSIEFGLSEDELEMYYQLYIEVILGDGVRGK